MSTDTAGPGEPRGPSTHRWLWPVLAAAAVVAVVSVGTAVLLTRHGARSPGVGETGTPAPYAGYSWRLVSITTPAGTFPAPHVGDRTAPGVSFGRGGEFVADDSVNVTSGRYVTTARGFRVPDGMTSLVGYAGRDPRVLAAMQAVGAVGSGSDVATRVSGDTLVLRVKAYTLRLHRAGRAGFASPSASTVAPTPTAHS